MPSNTTEIVATDVLSVGPPGTQATTTPQVVAASRDSRVRIDIANDDAAVKVYLGKASTVTTATGYPLVAGATFSDRDYTGAIYAITASGTAALRVWEVG